MARKLPLSSAHETFSFSSFCFRVSPLLSFRGSLPPFWVQKRKSMVSIRNRTPKRMGPPPPKQMTTNPKFTRTHRPRTCDKGKRFRLRFSPALVFCIYDVGLAGRDSSFFGPGTIYGAQRRLISTKCRPDSEQHGEGTLFSCLPSFFLDVGQSFLLSSPLLSSPLLAEVHVKNKTVFLPWFYRHLLASPSAGRLEEQGNPGGLPELCQGGPREGLDRARGADGLPQPIPCLRPRQAHEGRLGGR